MQKATFDNQIYNTLIINVLQIHIVRTARTLWKHAHSNRGVLGAMCRKRKNHGCFRLEKENAMCMFGMQNHLC